MVCDFVKCHVCSWLLLSCAFLLVMDLKTTIYQNILHVRSYQLLSLAIELNHYMFKLDYISLAIGLMSMTVLMALRPLLM